MQKAIEYLEKRHDIIIENLKNEKKEYLAELQEINKAINWLKRIEELKLANVQKYEIIELPDQNTGFSEYRIMNDCETDDRTCWLELKKEDYPVFMTPGDLLIIRKP